MSTAFVQSDATLVNGSSGTTIACTLPSVVAGNLICLMAGMGAGELPATIADDQGNDYGSPSSPLVTSSGVGIWAAYNVTGGTTVITVTWTNANAQRVIVAHEVSGCAKANAFVAGAAQTEIAQAVGTDVATSGAFTPPAGSYLFAALYDVTGDPNVTFSPGTGFGAFRESTQPDTGTLAFASVDRVIATSASLEATFSYANLGGGNTWTAVILGAAFASAGIGPLLAGQRHHVVRP